MNPLHVLVNCLLILVLVSGPETPARSEQSVPCPTYHAYFPITRTPAPVAIREAKVVRNRSDHIRVFGEVITTSSRPVYAAAAEIRIYNDQNQLLGSFIVPAFLTATLPGQLNPFDIVTPIEGRIPHRVAVEMKSWNLESEEVYAPATVVISRTVDHTAFGFGVYTEIRNDGTTPLTDVEGVAWSLSQEYPLGGATPVTAYLGPGEVVSATFPVGMSAVVSPGIDLLSSVKISVQGKIGTGD